MLSDAYHVCIHCVVVALAVALMREYWTIYALHQDTETPLMAHYTGSGSNDQHSVKEDFIVCEDPMVYRNSGEETCGQRNRVNAAIITSTITDKHHQTTTAADNQRDYQEETDYGIWHQSNEHQHKQKDKLDADVGDGKEMDSLDGKDMTSSDGRDIDSVDDTDIDSSDKNIDSSDLRSKLESLNEEFHRKQSHKQSEVSRLISEGSSVWCKGVNHTERQCRFQNLCYFPLHQSFGFLHSSRSVIFGVPQDRFNPALLDVSSLKDHNTQYFNYVDLPASVLKHHDVSIIHRKTFVMHRFNADNLMHVFHDDLLPLFSTLRMLNGTNAHKGKPFDTQLLFMEGWQPGQHRKLYQYFSSLPIMYKSDLIGSDQVTCFSDVQFGLNKDTTWYQYGFKTPQGPIPDALVTSRHIKQFTDYFSGFLPAPTSGAKVNTPTGEDYIVLFTRKHNRLIINEIDLSVSLAKQYNLKVYTVGAESHEIGDIIRLIQSASILIGMHGSLLVLSMFLQPGSIIVELFPYAVNPDNYTPYRTLAGIQGMGLVYRPWRVTNKQHTITHPGRSWDMGGIKHLSKEQQERIETSPMVTPHLCCRNAEWLFRIYQDSIIDFKSLSSVIDSAVYYRTNYIPAPSKLPLKNADLPSSSSEDNLIVPPYTTYPAHVTDIQCQGSAQGSDPLDPSLVEHFYHSTMEPNHHNHHLEASQPSLTLQWVAPWNVNYLHAVEVSYEVWIQETGSDHYSAFILQRTHHRFTLGLKQKAHYSIWIRTILDNHILGPFNQEHITCQT